MKFFVYNKPPIEELGFLHDCAFATCENQVIYDDEPYCYEHSPDAGSHRSNYSARRAQLEHGFGVMDLHTQLMLDMRQQILGAIPDSARNVEINESYAAALEYFFDEMVHDISRIREYLTKIIAEEPINQRLPVLNG